MPLLKDSPLASGAVEGRYEVKVDLDRPVPRSLTTSTSTL